jgi:pimeloyl-ACP methyl ester carboxylesterase
VARIDLKEGPIEYRDTGGTGSVIVLLHGVLMDASLFDEVVDDLRTDHRCVVPTLPLGSHHLPMRPDADLSLHGFGRMVAEFLQRMDLHDVTLVLNDHAAGLATAGAHPERVGRLVVSSCEAFDNYPPGLPGRNLRLAAHLPGGLLAALHAMRLRPLRGLPIALGWMSKRPIPHDLADAWFRPARSDPAVRRDLARYARNCRRRDMVDVTARLATFDRPALVVWASEDRVMPLEHGRRLATLLGANLAEVADSYTLIPIDQPTVFARHVRHFITGTSTP